MSSTWQDDPWGGYYAPTAYDSRRDGLPPDPRTSEGGDTLLGRSVRKFALSGRGVQCREYLANAQLGIFDLLAREDDPDVKQQVDEWGGDTLTWSSLKNPAVAMETFSHVMLFFAIASIFPLSILAVIAVLEEDPHPVLFGLELAFGCFVLYKLARLALDRGWVKDKNDTVFNRRTGMMTLTRKGKRHEIPFVELEAGMRHVLQPPSLMRYHLFLYHRPTGMFAQHPSGNEHPYQVEVEWEYMQQFMDISRPLPDVPMFEPVRHKDPVTAEHDRRTGRPERYWRDMDYEEARAMQDKSRKAAETFPWGLTREEALSVGWQPSGYGEGVADKGQPKGEVAAENAGSSA
ncbi:MAG: hypothetical protein D6717_04710 [Gammaproteobacteria bacterium]|nr:MAG: hypothetical protein D6717_04710 [Gammaproteobacteria bacterium]